MSNLVSNKKHSYLSCIDIYGNKLTVSKNKKGKIKFTLYHDEVIEGCARKDFEDFSLKITEESGPMYQVAQELYAITGSKVVVSEDAIRDRNNFMFIEQYSEQAYNLTIGRDLSNELNLPNQTNIEISGQSYNNLYQEVDKEGSRLIKTRELPQ